MCQSNSHCQTRRKDLVRLHAIQVFHLLMVKQKDQMQHALWRQIVLLLMGQKQLQALLHKLPHAPGSAEDVPPCSSDAVQRVQGEQLELSDSNVRAMQHRLLQEIQSAWPWLGIPVTPKPEVNVHDHDSDLEDLLPLTSLVQAQAVEHHPLEPVHQSYRVMVYKPSKLRPHGVIAIRERSGFKSQVGSASIPPGVTIEEAQDIAGRFVEALEAGQILDSDLTELLRDTLLWVAAGQ